MLGQLGELKDMELHFVGIQEVAGVLRDMETRVKFRFLVEQYEVQDADAYALFKHTIFSIMG